MGLTKCPKCKKECVDDSVECDRCQQWYHYTCVDVDDSIGERDWFCEKCVDIKSATKTPTVIDTEKMALLETLEKTLNEKEELEKVVKNNTIELEEMRNILKEIQAQQAVTSAQSQKKEKETSQGQTQPAGSADESEFQRRIRVAIQRSSKEPEESAEANTKNHNNAATSSQIDVLTRLATSMNRPFLRKLPMFNGNLKDWPAFITIYESTTIEGNFSESDNIERLREALKGDAMKHVLSLLQFSTNASEVIEQLRKIYGRPDMLVVELTEELLSSKPMLSETDKRLKDLALAVSNHVQTMLAMKRKNELKNEYVLEKLVSKLHFNQLCKWRIFKRSNDEADMADFASFLLERVEEIPISMFVEHNQGNQRKGENRVNLHEDSGNSEKAKKVSCFHCQGPHPLYLCDKFKVLSVKDRERFAVNNKICRSCLSTKEHTHNNCKRMRKCGKNGCQLKHNRLLHREGDDKKSNQIPSQGGQSNQNWRSEVNVSGRNQNNPAVLSATAPYYDPNRQFIQNAAAAMPATNFNGHHEIAKTHEQLQCHSTMSKILFKVVPVRLSNEAKTKSIETFAFLDDGSSLTLVEKEIYEMLELTGKSEKLQIHWTGGMKRDEDTVRTELLISGTNNRKSFHLRNVHAINGIDLPIQTIDPRKLSDEYRHLRGIPIPEMKRARPMILIGLKHASLLTGQSIRKGGINEPVAVKTPLGWSVFGASTPSLQFNVDESRPVSSDAQTSVTSTASSKNKNFLYTIFDSAKEDEDLHKIVKDHFSTENFGVVPLKTDFVSAETRRACEIMEKTINFIGDRYEIGLLWRHDEVKLPNSYAMALRRLESEEKSLRKRNLLEWKQQHIREMLEKGYARKATQEDLQTNWPRIWYCPRFVVVNKNKIPPKPRDVADVAAKVKGVSLNTFLLSGPNNLTPLMRGLFVIRQFEVAVNADVKEMFHQVRITKQDQQCQRFLWRDGDQSQEPTVFIMQSMMFGPTCSPTESQFIKNFHAKKYQNVFPEAVEGIVENTYMDDYFNSHATVEEAERVSLNAIQICGEMGFELVGFQSNEMGLLNRLPQRCVKASLVSLDAQTTENYVTKILGMFWHALDDYFTFKLNRDELVQNMLNQNYRATKREVLKVVMRIFDPLGLIALYTIRGKVILQEIWREGVEWDELLPEQLQIEWSNFVSQLPNLEKLVIRRHYAPVNPNKCKTQLIVFVDASEKAYAAVVYARFESTNVHVALVMGKSRVAPVKRLSVPQLELQAAVLGVRLANTVKNLHSIKFETTIFLSDSKTVLSWIASSSCKYSTFVAVRIGEILETSTKKNWFKVSTKINVADDATKGFDTEMGDSNARWFSGPEFLKDPIESWPVEPAEIVKNVIKVDENARNLLHAEKEEKLELYNIIDTIRARFKSSWWSLVRVIAYIIRFSKATKGAITARTPHIGAEELNDAQLMLFRKIQLNAFPREVESFWRSQTREIPSDSSIRKLVPIMSEDLVIRANTRAQLANTSYGAKNPVILPNKHELVDVFIKSFHEKNLHLGEDTTIGDIREVAWIINIRRALRRVAAKCQWCKNHRAAPKNPIMGMLPPARLDFSSKPFNNVGIDAFGPYMVKFGRGTTKRYGLIFTCLTYRAVHIELLRDMSTNQVLMALRRFFSVRGASKKIFSDNGTNFVGAKNTLHKDLKMLQAQVGEEVAKKHQIDWKFIPAYSPWFGGAWERLIQSIKKCVDFLINGEITHDDVLETALKDAAFLMNRRPLTHVPIDHHDSEPLTPNTVLFGNIDDSTALAPGIFTEADAVSSLGYRRAQHLTNKFMKRWLREYLPEISRREKWYDRSEAVKIGDIVIVTEPNEPRNAWKKGRIIKLHPGPDSVVRSVDVMLADKTLLRNRSVGRLAILDVESASTNDGTQDTYVA